MHQLNRRRFLQLTAGGVAAGAVYKFGGFFGGTPHILKTRPVVKYSMAELRKLKISVHGWNDPKRFFPPLMEALFRSMQRDGLNVFWARHNQPVDSDMVVSCCWIQDNVIADAQKHNKNVLVMEQGYIQPRNKWPSLAFNGLARYAIYPPSPQDGGARFNQFFGDYLKPWRRKDDGYVLLVGQLPWDKSLYGLNMNAWLQEQADRLLGQGIEVVYRPHPVLLEISRATRKPYFVPEGARLSRSTLADDIAGAAYTVMYSSTTAVESVLAGVPAVVTCDGAIAWEVTSHDLGHPIFQPDRSAWCADLAWKQWRLEELEDGTAWEHTKQAILV